MFRALGQVSAIECDLLVQLTGNDDWPIALGSSGMPIFTAHSRKKMKKEKGIEREKEIPKPTIEGQLYIIRIVYAWSG